MLSKAGLATNGMIDKKHKHCPVFHAIISTMSRQLIEFEIKAMGNFDVIHALFTELKEKGITTEDQFNKLLIPKDRNDKDECARDLRSSTFTSYQRA